MESPRLKIREGSGFHACQTCSKHTPFVSTHRSSCVAITGDDGEIMTPDCAAELSSHPNSMSVIDRRATCTLSFEINPALGKMLSELPKNSWTANATKAVSLSLQAVPLLDGTLNTKDPSMGAITTEAQSHRNLPQRHDPRVRYAPRLHRDDPLHGLHSCADASLVRRLDQHQPLRHGIELPQAALDDPRFHGLQR